MPCPLFINGFMATGKSTVGRLVAARAGAEFVDLDQVVEERSGQTVAELFQTRGEPGFRALEREALKNLLESSKEVVVALGGGALLERGIRLAALDQGIVVTLEAGPDELMRRSAGGPARPLLAVPDPAARIRELLELRQPAYAEAHARLLTDGLDPNDVAARVFQVWKRAPIAVAAGDRSYSVDIGAAVIGERLGPLVGRAAKVVLVSDENVAPLHAHRVETALEACGLRALKVVLPPGEQHKRIATVERIWEAALGAGADRSSLFVGLGGGVVTDITGFAAASFMRGVRWIALPTTLLAMVDASVGGKTGVDLLAAKNAVGAFHQPSGVVCDAETLGTEPERGYLSSLAEVVKTALIGDKELFVLLEREGAAIRRRDREIVTEIVRRCIRVKARIVSADERESGLRAVLNLGHTVGHALESQGDYTRLTHGEAVSLGLVAALRIGERLGLTPDDLVRRSIDLQQALGLPTVLSDQPLGEAAGLIGHDKKRAGARLRFIVARAVGEVEAVDLGLEELVAHTRALA